MNQSNIDLLHLPNEILFIILKKLDNMDVLYSLLGVDNQRLDSIVEENTFTNTLNFVLTTPTDDTFSIADPILNRFCNSILPRIHYNVKSLILHSISMKHILLTGDYPNLTQLKLFNFNEKIVSSYFTVESPFRRIFQQQITDLILVFEKDFNEISSVHYTIDVYGYILKFFVNLKHLSIIGLFPHCFPFVQFRDIPLNICFSSTLCKLSISIENLEDCYALLDGRLKQLTTLIVDIIHSKYHSSNIYNTDNLPNLKCFSLTTCYCSTDTYDNRILPLFRRMLNLEELTLNITVVNRTTFIDGTFIYNEIFVHMPRLHMFYFYICTDTETDRLVRHLSKDDIQRTFTKILFQEVESIVNYPCSTVTCHVFSLPFMFEYLCCIGNIFPTIIFNHVKDLSVQDKVPFEHEFFIRIASSFPLLQKLSIINLRPQSANSNDNQLYSIVKYPYLISLRLMVVYHDYVEQFLNDTKTHLPRLTELAVDDNQLKLVTENFTRDTTRLNCIKVNKLDIDQTKVQSKDFYIYFPLLKPCFFSE
ncbi:unnamed protein product [Rotaria sp. Silwood2]|nr:unnamed protein product [Rotaria sp. Silwood2]